jgi:hypothetical protein
VRLLTYLFFCFHQNRSANAPVAGGHVHDGGTNVLVKLNGKQICDSKAIYGNSGKGDWKTIDHMQQCNSPVQVKKGDQVVVEANYDLELYKPREQHGGGMAETMALVALMFAS